MQKFDFKLHDPTYELQLQQSLTLKPYHFYIHVHPRADRANLRLVPGTRTPNGPQSRSPKVAGAVGKEGGHPLHVLYGSNTGSSEAFAQRIAGDAARYGKDTRTKVASVCF